MKKNMIIISVIIGIIAILVLIPQESKKEAGEVIICSAPSTINTGQIIEVTCSPTSTSQLTSWTIETPIPTNWAYAGKVITPAIDDVSFCKSDSGVIQCVSAAEIVGDVSPQIIIKFTAPGTPSNPITITTDYLTTASDSSSMEGSVTPLGVTFRQNCGDSECDGNQDYTGGTWQSCSSSGSQCDTEICCICSTGVNPLASEDLTQDSDCSDTSCSSGCGLDGCSTNIYSIARNIPNTCQAGYSCSQLTCASSPQCESDIDLDGYSSSCGDCALSDGDVNPSETEICNNDKDDDCASIEGTASWMGFYTYSSLDPYADVDCSDSTDWTEFKNYLLDWAVPANAYGHVVTWDELRRLLMFWATGTEV